MPVNGHDPLAAAVEQARAHQEGQRALMAALQQALMSPAVVRRAQVSLVAAQDTPDGMVLSVALPHGERWDVPLSRQARRSLARQLADAEPADLEGAA